MKSDENLKSILVSKMRKLHFYIAFIERIFLDLDNFLVFDNFLDFLACFIPSLLNSTLLLLLLFPEASFLPLFLLEAGLLSSFLLRTGLSGNHCRCYFQRLTSYRYSCQRLACCHYLYLRLACQVMQQFLVLR